MKKILAILLAVAMICALGATAFADDAVAPKDGGSKLTFTTGGEAGTYYGFGSVLAQKVSEVTSTNVTAITSGGSAANIDALDIGDAQLGFSQSDVLAYAYAGERTFEEIGAITNFSIVAPLYMEQVQIVTLNPDIKTVADLKGKAVSIGAAGSGTYFNAIDVLGAYDLTEDDIKPTYQSFADSAEALQDGQIDAAFVVAGAPTTAITSLAATHSVYLVSLDDAHIDTLIAESPYYSKYVIPAATYGMPEDATTIRYGVIQKFTVEPDALLEELQKRYVTYPDEKKEIFYEIIDSLFASTDKTIVRTEKEIRLLQENDMLTFRELSSGEKQMLVILLTVLLQDKKPYVLFMDEPEVSLHMEWQKQLIDIITQLNPNIQLILTTHSPAIIMNGWVDKVTEVNEITVR